MSESKYESLCLTTQQNRTLPNCRNIYTIQGWTMIYNGWMFPLYAGFMCWGKVCERNHVLKLCMFKLFTFVVFTSLVGKVLSTSYTSSFQYN